jgi:hypothetical protein
MTAKKKPEQEKKKEIPPAAECAKGSKGKDKAETKLKAAAELASEIKKLRAELKEIVKQVSLRIDGRIADTLQILEKRQAPGEPGTLPGAKVSLQLAKKLRGVKVKPDKGKLKDIAHICQLVCKIAEKMPKK